MSIGFVVPYQTKGVFTLLTPFENALVPRVIYTCIAARSLADTLASGEDAFTLYYEPFGLTEADFENDLITSEVLVSLQSSRGQVVRVPNKYISGMPDMGGIAYSKMAIQVDLGPVPQDLDLSYLETKLADTVMDVIGLSAQAYPVAITAEVLMSQSDYEEAETIRKNKINVVTTDYARYMAEKDLRIQAEVKIKALEDYIKSKFIP